jgi:hypothetical protein
VINVNQHGIKQTLDGEQVKLIISSFAICPLFFISLEKFILEAGIELIPFMFKVWVAALFDVPNILHSLCFGNIV